jgi:hypothetical protein
MTGSLNAFKKITMGGVYQEYSVDATCGKEHTELCLQQALKLHELHAHSTFYAFFVHCKKWPGYCSNKCFCQLFIANHSLGLFLPHYKLSSSAFTSRLTTTPPYDNPKTTLA